MMTTEAEKYFHVADQAASSRIAVDGVFPCPCCDTLVFGEAGGWEICGTCGWEDDPAQEAAPEMAGGANRVCLTEAQRNFRLTGHTDPNHHSVKCRPKLP
ncbi:CPCC family cysteine-rich protein [Rhizobium sp. NPDC090279]|uniref:CPCC family cysteine-rich protein n=1 Tax=Rhizobium sp. NPDC090279 TaxID=3364499 RepID=UPI00383AF4E5